GAVLLGRSGPLLWRATGAALGPGLYRHLQPGPAIRARAAAYMSRPALDGGALCGRRATLSGVDRLAAPFAADRASAAGAAPRLLQFAEIHAECHAAGHDPGR